MKPASLITAMFLCVVALAHLLRLASGVEITVGGTIVPVWVSALGVLGPGALALWLWQEQRDNPWTD